MTIGLKEALQQFEDAVSWFNGLSIVERQNVQTLITNDRIFKTLTTTDVSISEEQKEWLRKVSMLRALRILQEKLDG